MTRLGRRPRTIVTQSGGRYAADSSAAPAADCVRVLSAAYLPPL